MTRYGVYTDSDLTTPFADDATFQLANKDESISTKMTITSTTQLNFQTFYVIAASKGFAKTQSEVLAINIYICGFESIVYSTAPAPISATLTPGTGVQNLDHSSQSGLLSSSFTSCPIQNYEVITDQGTGALLGGTAVIADATNLQVDTSQAISGPLWLRVSTSGRGGHYDIPININLCGSETIQFSPSAPVAITQTYDKGTGSHTLDYSIQTNLLSSSNQACPIQTFDITTDQAGTQYTGSQVSLASNLITTDTSAAFNTPLFIRSLTVGGASYYIPLNIFVCGFETIVASTTPTGIVQEYANGIGIQYLDHTAQTSLLSSSHSGCPIQSRDVITDLASGTPLGGSSVTVDATNIITDTTIGFNTPLWLRSYTSSGAYYDIPLTIKVCGFQTIIGAATDIQLYYGVNTGTQTFDHTVSSSLLSTDSPACPILNFEIIDQATGNLLGDSSVIANLNNIITDTTSGTNKSLFLRAVSGGNVYRDIPLNINYCGSESIIVSGTVSPIEVTYQRNSVTESLSHTSMSSMLSSSMTECPIDKYNIITDTSSGALLGGTQITLDVSMNNIITLTTTAFNTPLWIRATTLGGVYYDIPLNIFVCGFETISASSSTQALHSTYQRLSSTEVLDHTLETNKLSSSHAGCPIQSREIITDQTSGTSLGGSSVSFDATNIIIDTSASFNTPIWLRTFTSGGSFYDIPLNIFVCGFETIIVSAPPVISITYNNGIGPQILDHTTQTGLLSSSHALCPITNSEIITDLSLGILLGGTPISHDATNIYTDTTNPFNTPIWLRTYTSGGNYYDFPLQIYVCGFETIIVPGATPTSIVKTYPRNSVTEILDHTSQTSLLTSSFASCPIQFFDIITQATGTSLGGSPITVDSTNIIAQTFTAFNNPLWLRTFTRGGAFYDIPLNIQICGYETITFTTAPVPIQITYQRDSVTQSLDHTSQTSLLSSSHTECPIQSYDIISDQKTGASLGGSPISVDSSNIITQTSSKFNTPLWLRTFTSGRVFYDIPLNIYICGFEIITASSPISSISATYQENTGIYPTLDYTAQTNLLSSSWPECPIIADKQFVLSTISTVLTGTQFTVDSQNIITDSITAFDQPLSLRILTSGGSYFDIPLDIVVCDDTLIGSIDSSIIIQETFSLNSGTQSYDVTQIQDTIKPAANRCPIVVYHIVDNNLATYTNPKLQLASKSVKIDTSDLVAVNNEKFYLRASMDGSSIERLVPIDFHFCGAEVVIVDDRKENTAITFEIGSEVKSFDITAQLDKFRSSDPKCPIVKYELYNQDKLLAYSSPLKVQLNKNFLFVETSSQFEENIELKASTQYGLAPNFLSLTVKVQNTQTSCQPPNLDLIEIKCTPNPMQHPDLLSFASKAQYEQGATKLNDDLFSHLNLDSDLLGKNTSLKNEISTAITIEVEPPFGKQIIKFDRASQTIDVASYDERFDGIYSCTLTIVSQRRIRVVKFVIRFEKNNFDEVIKIHKEDFGKNEENDQTANLTYSLRKFYSKIAKIDEHGEVQIKFSEPLNNPNITLFNQSINIFILPAPQTYDTLENKDPKVIYKKLKEKILVESSEFLNFTWKAINMTEDYMNFKIDFLYPLNISTSDNLRDQLIIQIEDSIQFRSKKLSFLGNDIMIWPIRRQLPHDEYVEEIMDSVESFTVGLLYTSIFTFVTNLFVMLWLNQIAQAFQHLNIILSQTMINIQSPSNVVFFLRLIKQITNAEILQPQYTTELILNFEKEDELMIKIKEEGDRTNLLNEHLIDMGYENFSPILNLGGIIFSIVIYIFLLILGFGTKITKKCIEKVSPQYIEQSKFLINQNQDLKIQKAQKVEEEIKMIAKKVLEQKRMRSQKSFEGGVQEEVQVRREKCFLFYMKLTQLSTKLSELIMFQFLFTVVTESFVTMLISGILWLDRCRFVNRYFQEKSEDQISEVINNTVGVLLIVLVSAITIIYFLMISVISFDRVKTVTFQQYIGFVLERLRIENRLQLLYNFWYTLRRLIIVLVALFISNHTGVQLMLFFYLNLASLIYIGLVRPFKGKILNQNELLSEFSTSVITIIQVSFTQFTPDPQQQFLMGWLFIGTIILCILFFQFYIFKNILRFAKLLCLRKCCKVKSSQSKENELSKLQKQEELKAENKKEVCNILDNNQEQANSVNAQQNEQNHQFTFGDVRNNDALQQNESHQAVLKKQRKITILAKEQIPQNIFQSEERSQFQGIKENKVIKKTHIHKESIYYLNEIEKVLQEDLNSQSVEEIHRRLKILKKAEADENTFHCQKTRQILQEKHQILNNELNSRLLDHKLRQKEKYKREQEKQSQDEWHLREQSAKIPKQVISASSSKKHTYSQPKKHGVNFAQQLDDLILIAEEQPSFGIKKQEISISNDSYQEEGKQEDSQESDSGEIIPENLEIKQWLYYETLGRSEMPEFCILDFDTKKIRVNQEKINWCMPPSKLGLNMSIAKMDHFLENYLMKDRQRHQLESLKQIYIERLIEKSKSN